MNNKIVEDSYKLASKLTYLSNSKEGELYLNDAIDEAVAFAHGSKEPSILIELLNLNPLLYSKGILSGVVDEVLADGSFAKTAKGKHLSALKQYALEAPYFENKNGCQMLFAISSQNKAKNKANACMSIIADLVDLADPDFNGALQSKITERETCISSMEAYSSMLKGFETGKMFKSARFAYLNEASQERLKSEGKQQNVVSAQFNAHLINSTMHFAEETPNDYFFFNTKVLNSSEMKYLETRCALKDGFISYDEANEQFKELGNQELTQVGKDCLNIGREIMANAESSDAPDME